MEIEEKKIIENDSIEEFVTKTMEKERPFHPFDYLQNDPQKDTIINHIKQCHRSKPNKADAKSYIEMVRSGDRLKMLDGGIKLHLLCDSVADEGFESIFDEIKDPDLTKDMLELIKSSKEDYLRADLARIVGNLLYKSAQKVDEFVNLGLIELYIAILAANNLNLKLADKILLGFGNTLWHRESHLKKFKEFNIVNHLEKIYKILQKETKTIHRLTKRFMWFVNFVLSEDIGTPEILRLVTIVGQVFKRLIKEGNFLDEFNVKVLKSCLYCIYNTFLCDLPDSIKELKIQKEVVGLLRNEIHKSSKQDVLTTSLGIINFFICKKGDFFQSVLDQGVVKNIAYLLETSKDALVRLKSCTYLANIALGDSSQSQQILDDRELIKSLMTISTEEGLEVRTKAVKTFNNLSYKANHQQLRILVRENIFELYYNILTQNDDQEIIWLALESIAMILDETAVQLGIGRTTPHPLCDNLERIGIKRKLLELAKSTEYDDTTNTLVGNILRVYFEIVD